jgi:AcrR family transcriptional regulator
MSKPDKKTKAEKTRELIVQEAAVLFNQRGFAGTSMDDIMKATGLSKGGLYGNFKNKEEIAVEAFQHAVLKVRNEVGNRTKVIENSLDKLKAVVYFYKERILDPPVEGGCPIQNTAIDADDNNPILKDRVKQEMDEWIDRMVYTLQKGMRKGEVKMEINAREFATRFIGTLEGGIMLAQLYKDVQYFDVMARQLLDMIEQIRK